LGVHEPTVDSRDPHWFNDDGFEDPYFTKGADKSLAPPGRKQATATEDFDVHISYL